MICRRRSVNMYSPRQVHFLLREAERLVGLANLSESMTIFQLEKLVVEMRAFHPALRKACEGKDTSDGAGNGN